MKSEESLIHCKCHSLDPFHQTSIMCPGTFANSLVFLFRKCLSRMVSPKTFLTTSECFTYSPRQVPMSRRDNLIWFDFDSVLMFDCLVRP
jgi:hypothetical protein